MSPAEIAMSLLTGLASGVATVAIIKADVRWLKEQVRQLWAAVNAIRVKTEFKA